MAYISDDTKEIGIKIVYYGPGSSGKSTNLTYMHNQLSPEARQKQLLTKVPIEEGGGVLTFDYLPSGLLGDYRIRFHLFTIPGPDDTPEVRKLILIGTDGLVFVADSSNERSQDNVNSLNELTDLLSQHKMAAENIPWVVQYNKRDVPRAKRVDQMEMDLNPRRVPSVEAIAKDGLGVMNTFKAISKLIIDRLQ